MDEPSEAAPPPPHAVSNEISDIAIVTSVEEQIEPQESSSKGMRHVSQWGRTNGAVGALAEDSSNGTVHVDNLFGYGKTTVPASAAPEPDDVVMLETLGESLSQQQHHQQQQLYQQGFGEKGEAASQAQEYSWQGVQQPDRQTSVFPSTGVMPPQAKRKRVDSTERMTGAGQVGESKAMMNWNTFGAVPTTGAGPREGQQLFGAGASSSDTVAAVRSLFETLIGDATAISEFITENVGSVIGSSGDSGVAPASWRDLDDIFKVGGPRNVDALPASPLNDPDTATVITLKVACEKLQLAVMHLNSSPLSEENTNEINLVDLAQSAARDFCRGIKCEVGHLVDTIMEREPFVRQLETMLAKELEKNKDYDHVHDRYEREVNDLKAELTALRDEDRRLRLFIATMQGRMKGQLDVARQLLGQRLVLFDANAY